MDFEEDTEPSAAWREVMRELSGECDQWLSELDTMQEEFNRWLDTAFDELEKEQSSEETIFQERGLCAEDVYQEAQTCRLKFQSKLAALGLSTDVPLRLCQELEELAQREPSEDLSELYCSLLCDGGFLLLSDEAAARDEIHQPMALWYLSYPTERASLLQTLPELRRLFGQFAVLMEQRHHPLPKDEGTRRSGPLLISCIKALGSSENNSVLRENLSYYMRVAEASPILKSVEPLFLFLLLTKHEKRMCKNMGLRIDMETLFKPKETIVDRNNGRNYTTYNQRLKKFQSLCHVFTNDPTVDFPLCWYSLDQLTSLGEFWRSGRSSQKNLPFPPSVEGLVTHARFSCSAYRTNVFLGGSDVSRAELDGFLGSTNPLVIRLMAGVADCLDRNCTAYLERFCRGDTEEVRGLCAEILIDVNVSACYQPKNDRDRVLTLAAVNESLLALEDFQAKQSLVRTGELLQQPQPQEK